MFRGIERFAQDPACCEDREVRHLALKVLHRALAFLLNFRPSPRHDGIRRLLGFGLHVPAQVFTLPGDLVQQSLALPTGLLELCLVFLGRGFSILLRPLGCLEAFLDLVPACLKDGEQPSPGEPVQHAKRDKEDQELRDQRRVQRQQPRLEPGHLPVICARRGFAKMRKSPRPRPMMGSASMNPMPMTISVKRRPWSSGWRAVPSTVRLETSPSPMPAPNALRPSNRPKAMTVAPNTIARSNANLLSGYPCAASTSVAMAM